LKTSTIYGEPNISDSSAANEYRHIAM